MANKTNEQMSASAQKPKVRVNTNGVDFMHVILKWVQVNVVPIIALPALAILAADDIKIHLVTTDHNHLSNEFALLVGIAVAALLMVNSHKD